MTALTPRQREVYEFIADFLAEFGYPPSYREIMERFEITSLNGVKCNLQAMEKKGAVEIDYGISRGIRLVGFDRCPCCGHKK